MIKSEIRARTDAQKAKILAFMADGQEKTFSQIAEATGIIKSTLENRMRELRDSEKVDYLGKRGNKGTQSIYQLHDPERILPTVKKPQATPPVMAWLGYPVSNQARVSS